MGPRWASERWTWGCATRGRQTDAMGGPVGLQGPRADGPWQGPKGRSRGPKSRPTVNPAPIPPSATACRFFRIWCGQPCRRDSGCQFAQPFQQLFRSIRRTSTWSALGAGFTAAGETGCAFHRTSSEPASHGRLAMRLHAERCAPTVHWCAPTACRAMRSHRMPSDALPRCTDALPRRAERCLPTARRAMRLASEAY